MSIINSNRFKHRLRVTTEPSHFSSDLQQPACKNNRLVYRQEDPPLQQESMNRGPLPRQQQKRSATEHYLDHFPVKTKEPFQEQKKRKPKRILRLQLPKEISSNSHLLGRGISRGSNSSGDSAKIFKIRSIVSIDPKINNSRQQSKDRKGYRYAESQKEDGVEDKTKNEKRKITLERYESMKSRNLVQQPGYFSSRVSCLFSSLQTELEAISRDEKNKKLLGITENLRTKNKQACSRILMRFLRQKVKNCKETFFYSLM